MIVCLKKGRIEGNRNLNKGWNGVVRQSLWLVFLSGSPACMNGSVLSGPAPGTGCKYHGRDREHLVLTAGRRTWSGAVVPVLCIIGIKVWCDIQDILPPGYFRCLMPVGGIGAVHLHDSDFGTDICVQEFLFSLSFRYVE